MKNQLQEYARRAVLNGTINGLKILSKLKTAEEKIKESLAKPTIVWGVGTYKYQSMLLEKINFPPDSDTVMIFTDPANKKFTTVILNKKKQLISCQTIGK